MLPVDPSIAGFGVKVAGLFWKDLPKPHNIATEFDYLNAPPGKPDNFSLYLDAVRTKEPRMLTRMFSRPTMHYSMIRQALNAHHINDPYLRAVYASNILRREWPSIYRPVPKNFPVGDPKDLFEQYFIELKPKKKPADKKPTQKKANFLSDYAYHFNNLYNPESYGFDIRTPTGRDDLRNIAVATGVGTGIGAIRGAIWPGYIEKFDDAGRLISKKQRHRLMGALRDAAASGATSAVSSAAGITAKKYMPEIESALNAAKERITNLLPVTTHRRDTNVDVNPVLFDRIKATV